GIGVQPFRQRLLEPSRMQAHIGRNPREPSLYVERLIGEVEAGPHLRQALEAVEPMNEPAANPLGDEADGAPGIDPEFEIVAVDLGRAEHELDEVALALEPERIRHRALDVVDGALQGAQRTLTHRMDAPDIGHLIAGANDP